MIRPNFNELYNIQDWAAQYWVQKGAPREKLNIGLALYGRSFKLPWSHTSDMIGCAAAGAGEAGLYTREAGFKSYYEVSSLFYTYYRKMSVVCTNECYKFSQERLLI